MFLGEPDLTRAPETKKFKREKHQCFTAVFIFLYFIIFLSTCKSETEKIVLINP